MNLINGLSRRGRALALGVAMVAVAGMNALGQAHPVSADPTGTVDGCKNAAADDTQYVLSAFQSAVRKSSSGAYAYKAPQLNATCPYWIVDAKMATYSPDVSISGGAYDLPSSAAFGGTIPTTMEDCNRFQLSVKFYKKLASASAFTTLGTGTASGSWSAGKCSLAWTAGSMKGVQATKSTTGWDTYRVAVRAKLRSSWQEAAVWVDLFIPPPN